jgi:predicted nucleotidyltransferase component of viral defense system
MDNFIKKTKEEISVILNETAERLNLSLQIIEKDFWVCWILKRLYSINELAPHIIFKGGTSLS